ncbi:MAG: hypothetical protein ACRDJH_21715 [Thermomicrobiales bacterium]
MDDLRFDDLARRLAGGTSRRGLLRGVIGGLLGGLAGLGATETLAARGPLGAACTRATQCASLKCADGVCCNASCTGQCEACDLAGQVGMCTPLPAGTQQHGARPACTGTGVCQASCDGATRNQCTSYPGLNVVCDDPVCAAGWQTTYGCGGDGTCHPTTTNCGLFVCNAEGTGCLTTCEENADCVGAAYCANGVCQGDQPPGQPCTTPDQCQSGLCVDGVCCTSTCDDPCQACNVPGNLGFCADIADGAACDDGNPCTDNDVCRNGNCHGTPLTCARLDQCHDAGVCDPATGQCSHPNSPDNTNCGDGQVCCAGICCAVGEECASGSCQPGQCLGLDQFCDPANNRCCQDEPTFCEATSTCHAANPGSDPTCCHRTGDFCTDTCDCCDFQLCRNSACCRLSDDPCDADDQCCSGVCCDGVCCNDFQACCNGACLAETEPCVGNVPMGGSCEETDDCVPGSGLVCADGGVDDTVVCGDVCCTSTLGASCAPNADGSGCRCCGSMGCGCPETVICNASNVVCGGLLADCATGGDCLSGLCALSGGPAQNCCHDLGGFCQAGVNSSCCGTVGCGSGGGAVCGGIGAPCTDGVECVSGACASGSCVNALVLPGDDDGLD